jgi:hypothetical protein
MRKKFEHNVIAGRLRNRISTSIRRCGGATIEIAGCSVEELRKHIESQFTDGMTWGNYSRVGWNLNYIKPCVEHDLTIESERLACFHFSNIQPLWTSKHVIKK